MENLTCPRCGTEMVIRALGATHGEGEVASCPEGHGVFLARADLGALVQAETDWHRNAAHHTAPLPRITADMTAPPPAKAPAEAWVATLF